MEDQGQQTRVRFCGKRMVNGYLYIDSTVNLFFFFLTRVRVLTSCSLCVPSSSMIPAPTASVSSATCCDRAILSDARPKDCWPANN